jgi:hypothetical protein
VPPAQGTRSIFKPSLMRSSEAIRRYIKIKNLLFALSPLQPAYVPFHLPVRINYQVSGLDDISVNLLAAPTFARRPLTFFFCCGTTPAKPAWDNEAFGMPSIILRPQPVPLTVPLSHYRAHDSPLPATFARTATRVSLVVLPYHNGWAILAHWLAGSCFLGSRLLCDCAR